MNKKLVLAALITFLPAGAMAADVPNVGGCGWGSKLMEGNEGIAGQVLAVTTNGTSGNQTFGITSGTSGCTQSGVVKSNWAAVMFIDGNKQALARDMSMGQGETLDALAKLIGVEDQDKAVFFRVAKENFGQIFPSENVTSEQVLTSLKDVLAANSELADYTKTI
jgi:hypothetical protein